MSHPMLDIAVDLAHRAGALLRAGRERDLSVQSKDHHDVVTEIDLASERLIVDGLRRSFPDHAVIGEEGGLQTAAARYTWLVDPLDGTLNYLHGIPFYAVSIGLLEDSLPLLGAVYDPLRDELFTAVAGAGAYLNGRRLRVSTIADLRRTMLTTGFPYDRFVNADNNLREFAALLLQVQDIRRPGSAALDLCNVAAGRSEGHWELGLKPWDVAAAGLIVREAGGLVTDYHGAAWQPLATNRLIAANPLIHPQLLAALTAVRSTVSH
jgi:myo-inositol-1(or 4)-monophosphatase